jgi:two-component system, OmpR family, sensor histidine kinase BaeS
LVIDFTGCKKQMSLRIKLVLILITVVIIAIGGTVLLVRLDTRVRVNEYLFRGGMMGLDPLVESLEQYYSDTGRWNGVSSVLEDYAGMMGSTMMQGRHGMRVMAGTDRIQVVGTDGIVIADTGTMPETGQAIAQDVLDESIQLKGERSETIGYLLVAGGGNQVRPGDELPLLQQLNTAAIRAGFIALFIALILALWLSSLLLKPVRKLTQAVQKFGSGDYNQRVKIRGQDELAILGNAFNDMTETLQRSEINRKELTADIAHELRTPLAVQRAQLEALEDGVYPLSLENLDPVLEQNQLLERLVDDLRTLALVDAGELTLRCVDLDIIDLVSGILDYFKPAAEAYKVTMELVTEHGGSSGMIWGDPDRLVQIMNNLLDNAIRHSPEGGHIQVTVDIGNEGVDILVKDDGPGIPPESLPYLFERFYRVDRSRSRNEGGTGLGLAIARQLARAHGGSLSAANHPSGGAVFTLHLMNDFRSNGIN